MAALGRGSAGASPFRFGLAALLAAVAVVYLPSLFNGLVWDDLLQIAGNPRLQSLAAAREYFGGLEGSYFRPLVFVSYAAERAVWGGGPFGAHLVNLSLHLFNTGLLVTLARRLGASPAAALLGGAIFALHPLQSEAVAYVSGRTDLLMTSGALLSWWALRARGAALARGVGAAAAGGLAMLSKESGFALLLLWPWLAWRGERSGAARLRLLAPGMVLGALLLLLRPGPWPDGGGLEAPVARLAAVGQAALTYARLLVWPTGLHVDRLTAAPIGAAALVSGGVAALCLVALVVWGLSRRSPVGEWTAWSAAFYLPVANLALLYPAIAVRALFTPEHNLYAPLAGIGVLLGGAAARRRRTAIAAALVVAAWAGLTAARLPDWRDEERLFGAAVAAGAASPRVWYDYGNALLARGALDDAAAAFEGAVARAPGDAAAWGNLGVVRQRQGDLAAAAGAYQQAVALAPGNAQVYENLGSLYAAQGDLPAARAAFAQALRLEPGREQSRRALAALDAALGR